MDVAEILSLLEKPTRNRWAFVYQIRDEAAVSDIVTALRTSTVPQTRAMLCYILNLRAGAEFFEGRTSETKRAVPVLLEALSDPDEVVRSDAVGALVHIGDPSAGPALLQAYRNEQDDFGLREMLAWAIGACHYTPAIPTMIEALASANKGLRYFAAVALGIIAAREAIAPLWKALAKESDSRAQQAMRKAIHALTHPSTEEEEIEHAITKLKQGATDHERQIAASALSALGRHALPPLLVLMQDEQFQVRLYAILAISGSGEHRDSDWYVHAYREQVQGPLIRALADQESAVRAAAAQALGNWGDGQAVEPLLAVIRDEDIEVRRTVVEALGFLPKDERALEPLLKAFFTDDDTLVRFNAASGLGRLREDDRAVNALIQGLLDSDAEVRQQAAEMLCWLTDERAIDALIQALQDSDAEVREWAIEAIWRLCIRNGDDLSAETIEKIRHSLVQALQDGNNEVRECAEKIGAWLD